MQTISHTIPEKEREKLNKLAGSKILQLFLEGGAMELGDETILEGKGKIFCSFQKEKAYSYLEVDFSTSLYKLESSKPFDLRTWSSDSFALELHTYKLAVSFGKRSTDWQSPNTVTEIAIQNSTLDLGPKEIKYLSCIVLKLTNGRSLAIERGDAEAGFLLHFDNPEFGNMFDVP